MTTPTDATDRATPPSPAGDMILLLADLQQDFVDLPLTVPFARLRRNVAALMELATIFDMPRVVTAVPMAEGKAPMLVRELEDARGDTPMIVRTTSNSLDDVRVRAAIEASGRQIILVGGIATEVAVQSASEMAP